MMSDQEYDSPPHTQRRRYYTCSSLSSDEEVVPRKLHKSSTISTHILKLLSDLKGEPNENAFLSNNNLISEFDPSNRTQTIDCWLRKVNECTVIYGWNENQTIHFALQKLVGLAKRWLESLPTLQYTWAEWQTKLRKAFSSKENYAHLLEEMLSRKSRPDEGMLEYFYEKLNLLNRCEITGKNAVDCIIHGISDMSIKNGALILNCVEPEDLIIYLSSQKPQVTNNNGGPSSKPIFCYNCHKRGHPFSLCYRPILRCKRCNRVGHNNLRCELEPKLNKPKGSFNGKNINIKTTSDSDHKYFETIKVEDRPSRV